MKVRSSALTLSAVSLYKSMVKAQQSKQNMPKFSQLSSFSE
jgi:hypothetical protein